MLASIIANLQNVPQPEVQSRLPTIKIDRGGGAGPTWPRYDLVDLMTAMRLFPEIANEDPVARVVRRNRWIGDVLPHVKEARERREAGVFLTGAQLGYVAGYEAGVAAQTPQVTQVPVDKIDPAVVPAAVVAKPVRRERSRGDHASGGAGLVVAALAIGALGALAVVHRRMR